MARWRWVETLVAGTAGRARRDITEIAQDVRSSAIPHLRVLLHGVEPTHLSNAPACQRVPIEGHALERSPLWIEANSTTCTHPDEELL
jgi:hypothetical protein